MKISATLRELMSLEQPQPSMAATGSTTAQRTRKKLPIWSYSAEKAVIDYFKHRPYLWNQKCSLYYNKKVKDSALAELANKLGVRYSVSAIKERWTNMRCTFMVNERKIARSRTGSDHHKGFVPTWPHYHDLKFLQSTYSRDRKPSYRGPKALKDEEGGSSMEENEDGESMDSSLNPATISSTADATSSVIEDAAWRIKMEKESVGSNSPLAPEYQMYEMDEADESLEHPSLTTGKNHLIEAYEALRNRRGIIAKPQDACDSFGNVVAASLRDMPSYHRACAQLEIQQVLLKYNPENPENFSPRDIMG